jgi:hypothetical protein
LVSFPTIGAVAEADFRIFRPVCWVVTFPAEAKVSALVGIPKAVTVRSNAKSMLHIRVFVFILFIPFLQKMQIHYNKEFFQKG